MAVNAEDIVLNIIARIKARLRQFDATMILYRVYFLLATVSAMLIIILLLSLQVEEQTITITRIFTTQEIIQSTAASLRITVAAQGKTCANICATSIAEALTRNVAPISPTSIPTTIFTPTPLPSSTLTPLPSPTATTIPSITPTPAATPTPTITPTDTTTPTHTPTFPPPTTTSPPVSPTDPPTPTPTVPIIITDMSPSSMTRNDGDTSMESLTVSGSNFAQGMDVHLGPWPVKIANVTPIEFTSTITRNIPPGMYNLITKHNERGFGHLQNAFTVYESADPLQTFESAHPIVYSGDDSNTPEQENVILIFLSIEAGITDEVYIFVEDPNAVAGDYQGMIDDYSGDGEFNSRYTYTVYGQGFYTASVKTVPPPDSIPEKYQIYSTVVTGTYSDQYLKLGPYPISEGHVVTYTQQTYYVFGLQVIGKGPSVDDANVFNVVMSTSENLSRDSVVGQVFAYSWFLTRYDGEENKFPNLYPYVQQGANAVQFNCDIDLDVPVSELDLRTPERFRQIPVNNGVCSNSLWPLQSGGGEAMTNWTIDLTSLPSKPQHVPFEAIWLWVADQSGIPLAIFTQAGLKAPP